MWVQIPLRPAFYSYFKTILQWWIYIYIYICSDPTLGNSLCGAIKLVKNADIDKYKYSGYDIVFDMKETFGFPAIGFVRIVIIFGVNRSSSPRIVNKKRDILGKAATQG